MFTIREANPEQDLPRIVEMINSVVIEPVTLEILSESYKHLREEWIVRRTVAVDADGTIVGYAATKRDPWMPPGEHALWLMSIAKHRRQGIGKALYDDALAFVLAHGATTLVSDVRDDLPDALAFAQHRGFAVTRHQFQSVLQIASFDETEYGPLVADLEKDGFRFFSMADVPASEENHRKLYNLNYSAVFDIPGSEAFGDFSFEDFQTHVINGDYYEPESQLIAAYEDDWIGMSAMRYIPATNALYINITGVDRRFRGRKLATALKILAVRYAKSVGADALLTKNDSENIPILKINQKMGFHPQPGLYVLRQRMENRT